jgi:hypothetical protein
MVNFNLYVIFEYFLHIILIREGCINIDTALFNFKEYGEKRKMPKSFKCGVCGSLFKNKDHMIIVANEGTRYIYDNDLYIETKNKNYCGVCLKRELRKRYDFKRGL